MQPPLESGDRRRRWGCSRTLGAPAPRWACLATAFTWLVLRWAWGSPTVVFRPSCVELLGFSFSSSLHNPRIQILHCAFFIYFVYFHLFSGMCPAKHVSPKTSGTRSKYMHMCQSLFISPVFWTIIGGSKYAIVTANKSPKLNLCSSRANS
jgi:hypothetical protein